MPEQCGRCNTEKMTKTKNREDFLGKVMWSWDLQMWKQCGSKLVKTWERSPTPMVDHQWAPENLGEFHGSMLNMSGKVGVSTNGVHLTSSFVCVSYFSLFNRVGHLFHPRYILGTKI